MNDRVSAGLGTPDIPKARWQKSSYSNGQANCVEVATSLPGLVAVRDSKDPDGVRVVVGAAEWRAFLREVTRRAQQR